MAARVWGCRSQNFDNHKFNVFTIKFKRRLIKTFKGVVCASIVFDVYLQISDIIKDTQYPVFEKGFFCLNNDWNEISKQTFIALPSYTVRNAYCLTAWKQLSDMSLQY